MLFSHDTLHFDPLQKSPLLQRPSKFNHTLAGNILNIIIELNLQKNRQQPFANSGKIFIPFKSLLVKRNNQNATDRFSFRIDQHAFCFRQLRKPNDDIFFMAFPDNSMIIFKTHDHEYLTTLPIILSLKKLIDTEHEIAITTYANMGNDTKFTLISNSDPEIFDILFENNSPPWNKKIRDIENDISKNIIAWADEINDLPMIIHPGHGPYHGKLGQDIPAPVPQLENLAYAWPPFLNYQNRTNEEIDELVKFVTSAWIYFTNRHKEFRTFGHLIMNSGSISQKKTIPARISLSLSNHPYDDQYILPYKEYLLKLLTSDKAPFDYSKIIKHRFQFQKDNNVTLVEFHPPDAERFSNHQLMNAAALFQSIANSLEPAN